jgi:hypothetical protein
MKTQLLCWGDPLTNNFVDRPSIFSFKPFRFLLLFTMFSMLAQVVLGQTPLVGWNWSGLTSSSTIVPTATAHSRVTVSSNIARNSLGATVNFVTRGYGSAGWGGNTAVQAVAADDFYSFTIIPQTGFAVSLTSLDPLSYQRSNTGPSDGEIQFSINSGTFTTTSGSGAALTFTTSSPATLGATAPPSSFTGDVALQDQKQSITMRLVPFNANPAGTFYLYDTGNSTGSDFTVNGRVLGTTTATITSLTSCSSTASASQSFTVEGSGLTVADVIVTAPTNFEVSTDNSTFSASVNITPTSGSVNTLVYIRIKSSAPSGAVSGSATITGGGFTSTAGLGVAVSGTVNAASTVSTNPSPSTVTYGTNASFTVAATSYVTPTYQWQEDITGTGTSWVNVSNGGVYSNATTATLTLTKPPFAMNGYLYRCVVTNPCGNTNSNQALLTVNKKALTVTGATVTSPKTYDGTTAATITGATLVGIISPDVVWWWNFCRCQHRYSKASNRSLDIRWCRCW